MGGDEHAVCVDGIALLQDKGHVPVRVENDVFSPPIIAGAGAGAGAAGVVAVVFVPVAAIVVHVRVRSE